MGRAGRSGPPLERSKPFKPLLPKAMASLGPGLCSFGRRCGARSKAMASRGLGHCSSGRSSPLFGRLEALHTLLDTILLNIRHSPGCCDIFKRDPGQTNTSPLEGRLERDDKHKSKIWNSVCPYTNGNNFPECVHKQVSNIPSHRGAQHTT